MVSREGTDLEYRWRAVRLRRRVVVWDSNPFNPYGGELARVIAAQHAVVRICRRNMKIPAAGVRHLAFLPSTGRSNAAKKVVGYLSSFTLLAFVSLRRHTVLILPWVSTKSEARAILLLQALGVATIVVAHNPTPQRDDLRGEPLSARVRERSCAVVVHDESMRSYAKVGGTPVQVAPHPSYAGWMQNAGDAPRSTEPVANRPFLLFVGAAREDKGFGLLPDIADRLAERGALLVVASGKLTIEQASQIAEHNNIHLIGDGINPVTDAELLAALASCRAVIAPYRDVTTSGTMVIALTVGAVVTAFDSDGARRLLSDEMIVPAGDIGALVDRALEGDAHAGDRSWLMPPSELDRRCRNAWVEVIEAIA